MIVLGAKGNQNVVGNELNGSGRTLATANVIPQTALVTTAEQGDPEKARIIRIGIAVQAKTNSGDATRADYPI